MPIIKSSMKDVRRIKSRTTRNSAEKNKIRTAVKAVRTSQNAEEAALKLRIAMKVLDKARAHRVIKCNTASRHVSRLSALVHNKFKK